MEDYKIESIKKVKLDKDDILVFSVKYQLPDTAYERLKKEIARITKHEKILILEDDMEVGIIKTENKDKTCQK